MGAKIEEQKRVDCSVHGKRQPSIEMADHGKLLARYCFKCWALLPLKLGLLKDYSKK